MVDLKPTFLSWLALQARRDDPDWPATATTFLAGRAYLESVNASPRAIEALREAWTEWERS